MSEIYMKLRIQHAKNKYEVEAELEETVLNLKVSRTFREIVLRLIRVCGRLLHAGKTRDSDGCDAWSAEAYLQEQGGDALFVNTV